MITNMVADHARWPKQDDPIFGLAAKAKEAISKFGKDKVIDSTLGALADDEGNLICMETVYNELKSLPNAEIAAYAQVAGQPDYLEAVQDACFRDYRPDAYIRAVATPGGTGSVKHAVTNYTNPGDSILVCDWFWGPYITISEEIGRKVFFFQLFNEKNEFNIDSFKENFDALIEKQKRLVAVLNTPANNPTGYSLSDSEWDAVLDIVKGHAKNEFRKRYRNTFGQRKRREEYMIRLVTPSKQYKLQIEEMLEEWYKEKESIVPYSIRRLDYRDFEAYLQGFQEEERGIEGFVKASTYFAYDDLRDKIVGAVNIRHYLNEKLLQTGGHIGDGVRPSERRKGFATQIIGLALEKCRELGITEVLMVCDKSNIGSAKSILKNNGKLENEIVTESGNTEQRYWITLK